MSWDWRKIIEVLILGQFVVDKVPPWHYFAISLTIFEVEEWIFIAELSWNGWFYYVTTLFYMENEHLQYEKVSMEGNGRNNCARENSYLLQFQLSKPGSR